MSAHLQSDHQHWIRQRVRLDWILSLVSQVESPSSYSVKLTFADPPQYCSVTLYTPLTPFTVLFTHVINDHENGHVDLQLLNDFAKSLKPACQVSATIDRFHSLCSMFCQIAEAYISAKSQEAVMTEFDDYLSTLGLLPQNASLENGMPFNGTDPSLPASYQDWYSGNVGLYGLIGDESGFGNLDQSFALQ